MADGSTPIEIEGDWVDTTDGDWVDSKAIKAPTAPPKVVLTPRRRNEAMGGPPKGYQAPGPPTGMPFYSSAVSLAKGAAPFLKPSTADEKLGGAADVLEGGLGIAGDVALSQLGLGTARRLGQVNPFNATLKETAANLTQDAWRKLGIPAIKGLAGAATGGMLGAGAADLLGLGSGGQRLLTEGGAVLGGAATGLRRKQEGGMELATGKAKPKFQPAPRTEPFTLALPPKEADLLRPDYEQRVERGVSEILQDHPDLVDGSFILTRPGSSLKTIRDYAAATADRVWQTGLRSVQPYIEKGATFIPSNTTRRMYEALPADPLGEGRLLADVTPQLQKEIMELDKKPMTFKKAWELWREWNADVGGLHTKSGVKGRQAVIANEADVAVKQARVDGLKEDIYNFLKTQDPAQAEHLMEVMNTYGSVAQVRNGMEGQLVNAYRQVPTGMINRIQNLGMAAAKIKGGGSVAWAAPNVKAAVSADNTIANQLLQGFKQFGAPLPKLAEWTPRSFYAPAARRDLVDRLMPPIPPSRQLPAPQGPVGVSGVTVPDTRGQIQQQTNRLAAGPRMLPAPAGPVGVSGTTVPDVRGQITQQTNQFNTGPLMLPPATPGGPARNVTGGLTQGNLGFGSQHSQVRSQVTTLPSQMPPQGRGGAAPGAIGPSRPTPAQMPSPPASGQPWPAGNALAPDAIAQYALRNRITYVQALRALQGGQ